jgi:hypothetical protein
VSASAVSAMDDGSYSEPRQRFCTVKEGGAALVGRVGPQCAK